MKIFSLRPAHSLVAASLLTLAFGVSPVSGSDNDVIQIEEHWELEVGGPDVARSAPQVTMIMSPSDSVDEDFFAFTINHSSFPDYSAGGYQLQRWHGGECQQSFHGMKTNPLESDGEVITWVQKLTINGGNLKFQVINGQSSSWNQFGGEGFAIVIPTDLNRLNGYRPAISLEQSGIGYAGNRVSSLVLQKLRWITADGEEHEMVAPIDIASDLDP